jgi:hypothetical protein
VENVVAALKKAIASNPKPGKHPAKLTTNIMLISKNQASKTVSILEVFYIIAVDFG